MLQNDLYHDDIFHLGFLIVYQKYITKRVQRQLVLVLRDDVGFCVSNICYYLINQSMFTPLSLSLYLSLFKESTRDQINAKNVVEVVSWMLYFLGSNLMVIYFYITYKTLEETCDDSRFENNCWCHLLIRSLKRLVNNKFI